MFFSFFRGSIKSRMKDFSKDFWAGTLEKSKKLGGVRSVSKKVQKMPVKKRHLKIYFDDPFPLLVLRLFVQMCLSLFSYAYAQLRLHPTSLYYRNCFSDTIIILPNWITILTVSNQGYIKKRVFKYARVFLFLV